MTPPCFPTDLISACRAFTGPQEGCSLAMYLDNAEDPSVTVAWGHRLATIEDAAAAFGCAPNDPELILDWDDICQKPGLSAMAYKRFTKWRLTVAQADAIFDADLQQHIANCQHRVYGFYRFPQPAQVVCVDIDLNVKGGIITFPKMTMAMAAGDWATAADESDRPQLPARSLATRSLLLSLIRPVS
jgi:GH24 family phage-related lysozyme (muramidase)